MTDAEETARAAPANEDPRAQVEALRRRDAVLEEVLAALCHDLRGPLNTMLGWASMLRRMAPAEMSRGLEVIERNVRLQAWILDDAIDLYRIAGGVEAEHATELDLEALTREVAAEVQSGIGSAVTFERAGLTPLVVRADAALLRRALRAVLTHFGRANDSAVRVSVGARDQSAWVALTEPRRGHFPFEGLEAFLKGGATQGFFTRGAGLALLVAHNAAKAHGGEVRSVPDGVEIALPLAQARAATPAPPAPHESPSSAAPERSLEGWSILVVDDDPNAREILEMILGQQGARVRTAESAAAALRAFRAQRPDLLVSDIGMPEQDGYDLIRQIRAWRPEQGSGVPAIALSALTRPEDRDRSLRAGFQIHVPKPISAPDVVEAVKSLLPRRDGAR